MSYADHYRAAKARQLDRLEGRALRATPALADWAYLNANGHAQMLALAARGWEVVLQDPSLRGLARRQYLMRKVRGE